MNPLIHCWILLWKFGWVICLKKICSNTRTCKISNRQLQNPWYNFFGHIFWYKFFFTGQPTQNFFRNCSSALPSTNIQSDYQQYSKCLLYILFQENLLQNNSKFSWELDIIPLHPSSDNLTYPVGMLCIEAAAVLCHLRDPETGI